MGVEEVGQEGDDAVDRQHENNTDDTSRRIESQLGASIEPGRMCVLFLLPRFRIMCGMLLHEKEGYYSRDDGEDDAYDQTDMVKSHL